MNITVEDIKLLSKGLPPKSNDLLREMTVGREYWLDRFKRHYLENYILNGGSKVKVLVGEAGTGKSHLVRSVLHDAQLLNYETIYLSAQECKLNDLVSLYKKVVESIDIDCLIQGICCLIAEEFGVSEAELENNHLIMHAIVSQFPSSGFAKRKIREKAVALTEMYDLKTSFRTFVCQVVASSIIEYNTEMIEIISKWLRGDALDAKERSKSCLFEKLQKRNARDWLNSLIQLIRLSGKNGLVIAFDDMEFLTQKSQKDGRRAFNFTKNAVYNIFELFRQLIDDTELLGHCLFLLSGRNELIEDRDRGFRAYDALWIRLQTGLIDSPKFNPFADLVDIDKHYALGTENNVSRDIYLKLTNLFSNSQVAIDKMQLDEPEVSYSSDLQQSVVDAVKYITGK